MAVSQGPQARPGGRRLRSQPGWLPRAVVGVVTVLTMFIGVPSAGASTPPLAAEPRASDSLTLLSGTSWLGPGPGEYRLRIAVHSSHPATEALSLILYGPLDSRSEFDVARSGAEANAFYIAPPVPLRSLHRSRSGGADLTLPVNKAGGVPLSHTGIYPVQVLLEDGGVRVGQPLTTFLSYAGPDAAAFPRLRLAIVVPSLDEVTGTATTTNAGAAQPSLVGDAALLASHRVPVTFGVDAAQLSALASGTAAQRMALVRLRAAVGAGDEVLPSTSVPVDVPALVASGLTGDLERLVTQGDAEVGQLLGQQPPASTWAFPGGLDSSTVPVLEHMGASQFALPGTNLSPLPASFQALTFAQPSRLGPDAGVAEVYGADPALSSELAPSGPPSQWPLLAQQFMAEVAMIDLERPSDSRGVVVMPPAGSKVPAGFLRDILAELPGDPLVEAVTLDDAFDHVAVAVSGDLPLSRSLVAAGPSKPLAGIGGLRAAAGEVVAAGKVFGAGSAFIRGLSARLVDSLASDLDARQRASDIGSVLDQARSQLAKLRLPSGATVTLTSLQGSVPLTLLSASSAPALVRLVLTSEELSFRAKRFPEGVCRPVGFGSESCQLTLAHPTTVLQIPISVRTPGVFQLSMRLLTFDGRSQITASTETVRSTAFPDVGLVLIVGAALFLVVWWARNARHGRRARQLVPAEADDDAGHEGGPAHEDAGDDVTAPLPGPPPL